MKSWRRPYAIRLLALSSLNPSSLIYVSLFFLTSKSSTEGACFLATLYELRSTNGFEKKKELLVEAAKWGGDGLRTNCLKLPAN